MVKKLANVYIDFIFLPLVLIHPFFMLPALMIYTRIYSEALAGVMSLIAVVCIGAAAIFLLFACERCIGVKRPWR